MDFSTELLRCPLCSTDPPKDEPLLFCDKCDVIFCDNCFKNLEQSTKKPAEPAPTEELDEDGWPKTPLHLLLGDRKIRHIFICRCALADFFHCHPVRPGHVYVNSPSRNDVRSIRQKTGVQAILSTRWIDFIRSSGTLSMNSSVNVIRDM